MAKGLLIALEGIDGAGTSTQVAALADHVRARGRHVVTTAEPSRGPIGMLLRRALRGEVPFERVPAGEEALALLFAADRLEHLENLVLPELGAGTVVISDRYVLSSFAYQASHLPLEWIQTINAHARPPDLSVFFRVSVATAAARRNARGGAPEHFDAAARQQRVADLYEQTLGLPNVGKICVVDAEATVDDVAAQLRRRVDAILGPTLKANMDPHSPGDG